MRDRRWLLWTMVLAGAGMLWLVGFTFHQHVWTNYASHVRATEVRQRLLAEWEKGDPVSQTKDHDYAQSGRVRQSDAFALLYIPRLGNHVWATPVLEGVDPSELNSGVGHYLGTALPGERGNFALAGHRATNGQPFANFDRLQRGDRIYVRTFNNWFVYVLDKDLKVKPRDVWVIDEQPGQISRQVASSNLMSLVTCDPRWGSARRWVWWGHLVKTYSSNEVPPEVANFENISNFP